MFAVTIFCWVPAWVDFTSQVELIRLHCTWSERELDVLILSWVESLEVFTGVQRRARRRQPADEEPDFTVAPRRRRRRVNLPEGGNADAGDGCSAEVGNLRCQVGRNLIKQLYIASHS